MNTANTQRGFSLIEIMAVVMLISIIATTSVVVFTSGGSDKALRQELEQFVDYSHQLSDLSILTGEPIGLVFTPPAWAEDPLETKGWSYTWRRYVEVPAEPEPTATEAAANDDGSGAAQVSVPQTATVGQWMDIENVDPVTLGPDIQIYVDIEGSEWDWRSTPKSDQPIFILFPTGEAEPFLFEVEFAHRNADLAEPQHVKLDETGRLQWVEAKEAMDALKEEYQ